MKRPEGFDPAGATPTPPPQSKPAQKKPAQRKPAQQASAQKVPPTKSATQKQAARTSAAQPPRQATTSAPRQHTSPIKASRSPRPDAAARADLRRAARERRRFERSEVRRFTRRARNRRLAIATLAGVIATLVGLVFLAIYSPILALRTITVDGTSRVDVAEVTKAVDGQLGTPLALIDYDIITEELGAFPLIRSYVTEVVPPNTLLIHVTERQPVGSVAVPAGFELVDAAGVTVQQSVERIPGVPLIDLPTGDLTSTAFTSMVEVLLALPPDLLAQVDRISASTQDDVTLTLAGVGQTVAWGSADSSTRKATLLAALIRLTDPAAAGTFDVSAPGNGVFRPS